MFLHRLRQLLSQVCLRLTRRLHSSSTESLGRESQVVTPARYLQNTAASLPVSGLASGRWLDDTRRMRPRLSTPDGWSAYDRQNRWMRSVRPNTLPLISSRPQDRTVGRSSSTHETSEPAPQPEPAAIQPAGGGDQPGNHENRRRLMALKYLVRLGIYNEGFISSSVPDQYQHSLGMDELGKNFQPQDNDESTPG